MTEDLNIEVHISINDCVKTKNGLKVNHNSVKDCIKVSDCKGPTFEVHSSIKIEYCRKPHTWSSQQDQKMQSFNNIKERA